MEKEKTHVVNVVEFPDKTEPHNIHVVSFNDTKEGNMEAEKHLFSLAKENGYEGDDFDEFMEEAGDLYENGDYMVLITHS